jgi:hypothetical protein
MGCGCIAALMAVFAPRFVLAMLQIFSDRLSIAFDSFVVGFLGFLFVPYATVFYALLYDPFDGGLSTFDWVIVAFGLFLDLSSYFGGEASRRRQYA